MKRLLLGLLIAVGLTGAASAHEFTIRNDANASISIKWRSKDAVKVIWPALSKVYTPGENIDGIVILQGTTLTIETTLNDQEMDVYVEPVLAQYGETHYKVDKYNDWGVNYTGTAFQLWRSEINNYTGPIPATDLTPAKSWKNIQDAINQPFNY